MGQAGIKGNAGVPSGKSRRKDSATVARNTIPSFAQSDAIVQQQQQHVVGARADMLLMGGAAVGSSGERPAEFSSTSLPNLHSSKATAPLYPIVINYADKGVKTLLERKENVYVAVESMNWQPIPMTPSTDSFFAILQLPPGCHNYRFVVRNAEVVDRTQPLFSGKMAEAEAEAAQGPPPLSADKGAKQTTVTSGETEAQVRMQEQPRAPLDGRDANYILLNEALHQTGASEDDATLTAALGDGDWGQEEVMFEENRKFPPIMPLHLRYTPLNTPPTPFRCSPDGRMILLEDAGGEARPSPEHLPLPLSVTINHVYFQRRDDHAVMGMTTRYGNKCSTIVYYTSLNNTNNNNNTNTNMNPSSSSIPRPG